MITRRVAMAFLGLLAGVAAFMPLNGARAQDASMLELGVAGPLGDIPMGPENAKVTIYEYSSFTCNHCGDYKTNTFPELKKKYIDTGKVRYIRRELSFDPLAMGAAMLARCSGKEKYEAVSELLFQQQEKWAFTEKPLDGLRTIMRQTGMSDEQFDSCLKDQKTLDGLLAVKNRASDVLKIESTPTFFINGKRVLGARPIADFEKEIDEALAK